MSLSDIAHRLGATEICLNIFLRNYNSRALLKIDIGQPDALHGRP